MDPAFAAALLQDRRLDAEILRRRRLREAAEEQEWLEQDPSGFLSIINQLTRALNRAVAEADKPRPLGARRPDPDLLERRREEWEEFLDQAGGIIEGVERLIAVEADEAAGIVRRPGGTRVKVRQLARAPLPPRPAPPREPRGPGLGQHPVAAGPAPPSGASAGLAAAPQPEAPRADGAGWRPAVVKVFNSVMLSGVVVVDAMHEMALSSAVFTRSGLTVLSPGQRIVARVVVSAAGGRTIDAIESRSSMWDEPGAAARAERLADERIKIQLARRAMEREAIAAEARYGGR